MFVAGQRPLVVVVIITGAQEEVRRSSLKRRKSEETDIWAWSTMFSQILVFLPKSTRAYDDDTPLLFWERDSSNAFICLTMMMCFYP